MPPRITRKDDKKRKSNKKNKTPQVEEEEEDTKESQTQEEPESQSELRRVEVNLDPKYQVPECYVKFFENNKPPKNPDNNEKKVMIKKKSFLLTIKVEKKKGTKTTLSWDSKKSPLSENQISVLKKSQKDLGTSCKVEPNSIIFFGTFDEYLKEYLLDKCNFKEDDINIIQLKPEVPNYFKIIIIVKEDSEYTKVKWKPWKTHTYKQFVDEFRSTITNEWKLPEPEEIDRKSNHVFILKGNNLADTLNEYFTNVWSIDPKKIEIEMKSRDYEPTIVPEIQQKHTRNPLLEMTTLFEDFDDSSYYKKMSDTIQACYLYSKERLENFVIKTNLNFIKSFSDGSDRHGKDIYSVKFNVLKAISIDGIKSGRFLSEGDSVIVRYMNRKRPFKGSIVEMKKGIVTATFKVKHGRVPPGCKRNPQDKEDSGDESSDDENELPNNNNEKDSDSDNDNDNNSEKDSDNDNDNDNNNGNNEEEENNNDDDIEEEDYDDIEEEDENDDISKKLDDEDLSKYPYSVSFEPSDTIFQRSALGLLNLYDMKNSPIKKIIVGEQINSSTANKSSNEIINDASFDLTDSPYLSDEEREDPNFMKFLKLEATVSQTRCVEMILQNNISIVHGPPGCGKTSSISLFVYHLLKKVVAEKKRILLTAYSNQAVENIAKFVSPIVKALGKKMVWITRKSFDFETKADFLEASEEEKNLSVYKILTRNTKEATKFKNLQEIKWDLNVKKRDYRRAKKENKYFPGGKPRRFSLYEQNQMDDIRSKIEQSLVFEADVVCSTLLSSAKRNMVDFKFDYVFIDEASQADQTVSIIPLIHHPSKLVLLGDHKQLDANFPNKLNEKYKDTLKSLYRKLLKNQIHHEMLNVQFRMNPLIAQFPNKEFYKGRIVNAPGMEEKTHVELTNIPTPIAFIDVSKGKERKVFGTTYRNMKEADAVEKIINNFKKNNISPRDVGVITPYHGQVHILRKKINSLDYNGLRISSVDTFQGSERDFIILSLVRTNSIGKFGFLPDKHRINVSLTRARKGIIIVGNFNAILNSNKNNQNPENQFLVDMCKFYQQNNAVYDVDDPRIERIKIRVTKNTNTSKLFITNVPNAPAKPSNPNLASNENQHDNDNVSNTTNSSDTIFGNRIGSPSSGVYIPAQIPEFEYDVDSDYDDNAVTADDDDYYKTK